MAANPRQADKARRVETLAVLALACIVIATLRRHHAGIPWLDDPWLVAATVFLVIGCFVAPVASLITRAWFGLSHVLGAVMSRVVMAAVYFAVLLPLSLLRRLFEADPLHLRRDPKRASYFTEVNRAYGSRDLAKPW
ncbi:MAG: hypothetical protein IT577_20655 [Verrucomicrobiae bacterium]|nr:hypothetical protein [Verrucomicrobiae bacterium]